MNIIRIILIIPVLLGVFLCKAGAGDLPLDMLKRLQNIHQDIQTISGSFVQEKRLAIFEQTLVSKGTFAVVKPGKIHWAYEYPSSFGFASDGENLRRWSRESGESESIPLARDPVLSIIVDQMLAWSTMDIQTLERYFSISLAQSRPIALLLEPKTVQLKDIIRSVEIIFDSAEKHIKKIAILEYDGDETMIRFENVTLNSKLPSGLF